MSAWAKPGVKCVCVEACEDGPAKREVCVVSELVTHRDHLFLYIRGYGGWIAVTETRRKRIAFGVHRFRPLVTRTQEQDLEHFLPLLKSVEEHA